MIGSATGGATLGGVVERLERLEPADFQDGAVTELLGEAVIDAVSLRPFVRFREDKYARNLILRSPLFDLIVLCWRPGQATPVHDHSGQLGWVRVLLGRVEETAYRPATSGAGPAGRYSLEETGSTIVHAGPDVLTVDRLRAIHRLGNPVTPDHCERAVTLHCYSRPHDACTVFDLASQTRRRQTLTFDNLGP